MLARNLAIITIFVNFAAPLYFTVTAVSGWIISKYIKRIFAKVKARTARFNFAFMLKLLADFILIITAF
jgi:hypothetical protein